MLPDQIKQSEIREIERPRLKSNPHIYYRNKHNNVIPYVENNMQHLISQESSASCNKKKSDKNAEPIGIKIGGEYITEEQFHEYCMKKQSEIKDWDQEFLEEKPKKKTESILGYLYKWFVSDTQNNKKEEIKEKYKETLEKLEVRTPSWPLFVEKEEFNKDVLNQQKITIEKKMLDDLEHYTVFKWHPLHLRKITTPMSEKSAEISPPVTTYFTKKSKISP